MRSRQRGRLEPLRSVIAPTRSPDPLAPKRTPAERTTASHQGGARRRIARLSPVTIHRVAGSLEKGPEGRAVGRVAGRLSGRTGWFPAALLMGWSGGWPRTSSTRPSRAAAGPPPAGSIRWSGPGTRCETATRRTRAVGSVEPALSRPQERCSTRSPGPKERAPPRGARGISASPRSGPHGVRRTSPWRPLRTTRHPSDVSWRSRSAPPRRARAQTMCVRSSP